MAQHGLAANGELESRTALPQYRGLCPPQRAINLSDAQKHSLLEGLARLFTDSELAHRRRRELWQQLDCRMVGDDRRSMERLAVVRVIPWLRTLLSAQPLSRSCRCV